MIDVLHKITAQRTARNWTEYQLSVRSGLPQSTISSWYRKDMLPSLSSLEKICAAFDMTLAQFFSEGNYRELDSHEEELLHHWELLTPEQKDNFIGLMRTMTHLE